MNSDSTQPPSERYTRQTAYAPLGPEGQRRLASGSVLICGCGALGTTTANLLVRAGVGRLRIVDRDRVELHNLQRQVLFDEEDAAEQRPKALAAAKHLAGINSEISIEPIVDEIGPSNIERLLDGVDVMVDGTDNFPTRYLMNDAAVKHGKPWIFGGCVGTEGQSMTIVPDSTPCLRCLWPECPGSESVPTCPTHGILGPTVGLIASLETIEAIKLLSGNMESISPFLTVVQLWDNKFHQIHLDSLRTSTDCPTCKHQQFSWLDG